jgi:hypothetical protein
MQFSLLRVYMYNCVCVQLIFVMWFKAVGLMNINYVNVFNCFSFK